MNYSPNERHEFAAGFITLTPEGYFYVQMKDGMVSTVDTVKESHIIMLRMQPEGPMFILADAGRGSGSDDEIYEYLNQSEFKKRVKAQAILVHDLATRLMGNIFLRFVKKERAIKIFSKEIDAKNWLLEQMKETDSNHSKKSLRMFTF